MSDAPERIWAWSETDGECVERFWIKNPDRVDGTETKYIRADLHEALRAENARLDSACVEWAEVSQANYQRALAAEADNARLWEAMLPSPDTKAAYMGEFTVPVPYVDEYGDEVMGRVNVPWTTIKEIMAAIRARAALETKKSPRRLNRGPW